MFLGHELIIASPKSFAVCFLFKYGISHQQESLTISCPCLISASGNKGMLERLGADPNGEMIGRGFDADLGTQGEVSCTPSSVGLLVLEFAQLQRLQSTSIQLHSFAIT